jgi:hypothetical protein
MKHLKSFTLITGSVVTGILASGAVTPAQAFTFERGEDLTAGSSSAVIPNSRAAEARFLARLSAFSSEGFESFAADATPRTTALNLPGINASISGIPANDATNPNSEKNGVIAGVGGFSNFPISGTKSYSFDFYEQPGFNNAASSRTLTINFAAPVAAFGFYGTDFGDDNGSFSLEVRNGVTSLGTVAVGNNQGGASQNGAALYFGVIAQNPGEQFTSLTFRSSSQVEFIGIDNLTVATLAQVRSTAVPEPFTMIGTLLGSATALQMRKRLKVTNKL